MRDENVLRRREAQLAATVVVGEARQLEELIAGDAADRRLEPDVVQSRCPLAEDADVVGDRGTPRVASGRRQRPAEIGLELLPKPGASPLLHEEGQAGSAPRLARAVIAEDPRDRRADLGRFVGGHERVERGRESRPARSLLAPDGDVEAGQLGAVSRRQRGGHRDVLGLAAGAVIEAAGDRDVELAREVRELLVAEEDTLEADRDRRGVEELAGRETGRRTSDDAADVVHSGL